ncbi:41849_t:CDS:2 [Gigaspora margarita]|uniref:41849_t:CDS:1 n=1 Tax=Gigaspora margarita TaxID=4874 RepID=A0ABN7VE99_GIGMA|nr:41849_t:CDS:2 [Gigaspora margarita]
MASPEISTPDSVYPPIPGENHRYYGNIHKKQVILHSNVQAFGDTSSFPQVFVNNMDIHEAAATGNIDRVKELLDPQGAGETTSSFLLANEVSSASGLTPLHYAASRGHTDIVKWLVIDAGAIIDLEDQTGETALLKASYNGHLSIVAWLLKKSANVEQKDNDGWTALHNASSQGHLLVVKHLLEHTSANVDVKSNKGHTPLMNAASKGHIVVVRYLLNHGNANPFIKNSSGESAYDVAALSQQVYICELLEKVERDWWKNKRLLQTTSFDDYMNLPATNQPYDVYVFHNTVPVILHENQRLSSSFSLSIRNPPKFSANNLLKSDSCSPWSLHPEGKPCTKDEVQLPLGPSLSSTSSKPSQNDWEWFTEWAVDESYPRVGPQGWQYAKKFDDPDSFWSESLPSNSNVGVRRRRWVRIMKRHVDISDELDYLERADAIFKKYPTNSKGKSVDLSFTDKSARYKEAIEILSSGIKTDHNEQRKSKATLLKKNLTQLVEFQGSNSHDIPTAPNMLKPLSPTSPSYRSDATISNNETPSTASSETIEQPWIDLTAPSSPRTHPQTGIDMTNAQAPTSHNQFKWENDEDANECRLCNKKFRLWTRRHHCRRCGQIVCDQCSTKRAIIPPSQVISDPSSSDVVVQHSQYHRVCDSCFKAMGHS